MFGHCGPTNMNASWYALVLAAVQRTRATVPARTPNGTVTMAYEANDSPSYTVGAVHVAHDVLLGVHDAMPAAAHVKPRSSDSCSATVPDEGARHDSPDVINRLNCTNIGWDAGILTSMVVAVKTGATAVPNTKTPTLLGVQ